MALRFSARGSINSFLNVYLDDGLGLNTTIIGSIISTGQLISVPAALLAPALITRWGSKRTIFWSAIAMMSLTLPLALVPISSVVGVSFVGHSIFFYLTAGPMRLFSQQEVDEPWRTSMASAFMLGASLGFSALSYAGGYLIAGAGYRALFLVSAGLTLISAIAFWLYASRHDLRRAFGPRTTFKENHYDRHHRL
jgi:MFS family permease